MATAGCIVVDGDGRAPAASRAIAVHDSRCFVEEEQQFLSLLVDE
jgi:hypothetical protein